MGGAMEGGPSQTLDVLGRRILVMFANMENLRDSICVSPSPLEELTC